MLLVQIGFIMLLCYMQLVKLLHPLQYYVTRADRLYYVLCYMQLVKLLHPLQYYVTPADILLWFVCFESLY